MKEPEQELEPREDAVPLCPICAEETDTYYVNAEGEIVGCDSCVEPRDAWSVVCHGRREDRW